MFSVGKYLQQFLVFFFFQAEDGIRDRSPSRGLGDVYKRQVHRSRQSIYIKKEVSAGFREPGDGYHLYPDW